MYTARRPLSESTRQHSLKTTIGSSRKKKTTDIATAVNVSLANGRVSTSPRTTSAAGARSDAAVRPSRGCGRSPSRSPRSRAPRGQETAATTEIEHTIIRTERQGVEDRSACPVVDVVCAVDLASSRAGRATCNPVRQPVVEVIVWQAAVAPRREIVVTEAERLQRVGMAGRIVAPHYAAILRAHRSSAPVFGGHSGTVAQATVPAAQPSVVLSAVSPCRWATFHSPSSRR